MTGMHVALSQWVFVREGTRLRPVTNAQYAAFVQTNLRWRRSQASSLLADAAYLHHWQADFPPPEVAAAIAPQDTPTVLSAHSARLGLDPMFWSLLSGRPEDVRELATLLGIKYKRDQRGGFIHSNVITVLNKAGEMMHRHEGLQQDIASTLEAIRRAVQD
jgi:hypothetical protein